MWQQAAKSAQLAAPGSGGGGCDHPASATVHHPVYPPYASPVLMDLWRQLILLQQQQQQHALVLQPNHHDAAAAAAAAALRAAAAMQMHISAATTPSAHAAASSSTTQSATLAANIGPSNNSNYHHNTATTTGYFNAAGDSRSFPSHHYSSDGVPYDSNATAFLPLCSAAALPMPPPSSHFAWSSLSTQKLHHASGTSIFNNNATAKHNKNGGDSDDKNDASSDVKDDKLLLESNRQPSLSAAAAVDDGQQKPAASWCVVPSILPRTLHQRPAATTANDGSINSCALLQVTTPSSFMAARTAALLGHPSGVVSPLPSPASIPFFTLRRNAHRLNKPRRARTAFTNEQTDSLEGEYKRNEYISKNRRHQLASHLGLTEVQIKIWYQNRRAKDKRIEKAKADRQTRLLSGAPSTADSAAAAALASFSHQVIPSSSIAAPTNTTGNDSKTAAAHAFLEFLRHHQAAAAVAAKSSAVGNVAVPATTCCPNESLAVPATTTVTACERQDVKPGSPANAAKHSHHDEMAFSSARR